MKEVLNDWRNDRLKKVYNYMTQQPPIGDVEPARRDLYKRELYNHKGVQMVDLFHASRGCRFSCYPCAVSYLGGRIFRPRPIDKVIEDLASIENNRLFIVDNSLAQNKEWEMELKYEEILANTATRPTDRFTTGVSRTADSVCSHFNLFFRFFT